MNEPTPISEHDRTIARRLDGLRAEGDPLFDPILADLGRTGGPGATARAMGGYVRNDQAPPAELPAGLRAALEATARVPAWVDHARLDRAADLFAEHAVSTAFLLGTTSLLECYAAGKGVQALHATREMLHARLAPRLGRTAGFVLAVTAPGAFSAGGGAVPALLKVRVMHAAVRAHLTSACGWDAASRGAPICQEDQLGTLLAFAYSPLLKLRLLGARVSRAAVEDALHLWRAAGEVLGARAEWIPRTEPEAEALMRTIFERQLCPTPQGVELAGALVASHCATLPSPALRGQFLATLRRLLGARVYDALELPAAPARAWVVESATLRTLMSSRLAGAASRRIGIPALRFQAQRLVAA